MALKLTYVSDMYKITVTETGEIDKVKGIALCLGYSVIDVGLHGSIELIDYAGEYQGYYDPLIGIGAIWIDDDSEAHFNFNNLGGAKWLATV